MSTPRLDQRSNATTRLVTGSADEHTANNGVYRPRRPLELRRGSTAHRTLIVVGVVLAGCIALWGASQGPFSQGQLTRVAIYAIAIAGLNVATGYTGLLSIGHSAFFGLGAYTTGVLVVKYGWQPLATIPMALVVCFVAGLIVGLPSLRIRGLYLAMVTLAFGIAFPEFIARFEGLTGGAEGLTIRRTMLRPPRWSGFTLGEKETWLYWLSLVMLALVMVIVHNVVRSRFGLALIAVRDNEIAASASGINVAVMKTTAFGLSGGLTGIGGSLFAMYLGTVYAEGSFTLTMAITLLTGLVIGGQATRLGPIVGAVAVVYIPYYTSDIGQGQASAVLFGIVLIAISLIAPEGVVGAIARRLGSFVRLVPSVPRPLRTVADRLAENPAAPPSQRLPTTEPTGGPSGPNGAASA